jgi:serine/threonine protein kinase
MHRRTRGRSRTPLTLPGCIKGQTALHSHIATRAVFDDDRTEHDESGVDLILFRSVVFHGTRLSSQLARSVANTSGGLGLREVARISRDILTAFASFAAESPTVLLPTISESNVVLLGSRATQRAILVNDGSLEFETDLFAAHTPETTHTTSIDAMFGFPLTWQSTMWSFGCLFAWMLTGVPLFAAGHTERHLVDILRTVGHPTGARLEHVPLFNRGVATRALRYTQPRYVIRSSISARMRTGCRPMCEDSLDSVVDFIVCALNPNAESRMTIKEALAHPVLNMRSKWA